MVIVYGKQGCVQCKATTRKLTELNVEYQYIDLSLDQQAYEHVKELGYTSAPVVETGFSTWSGFQPDQLTALSQ